MRVPERHARHGAHATVSVVRMITRDRTFSGERMHETMTKAKLLLIVVLLAGASGCVVAPRYHDGYYDHDHDR